MLISYTLYICYTYTHVHASVFCFSAVSQVHEASNYRPGKGETSDEVSTTKDMNIKFLKFFCNFNRLNAEFTRTPEHRNAILIFKRNHVAAASQQKQVLVRLTGILQAFLTYEKKVELLMELMS